MSRRLSRQLSVLFTARSSRARRRSGRSRPRTLEMLEPRTLLSNWFVNSSNTNPSPDGSSGNPYETIQAAINAAQPSDTILVETGSGYNESDTVGVSSLTIEADSGQSPVLDGTTPSAQSSPGFTITAGTTGVTIEGFTVQNFSGTSAVVVGSGASLTLSADTIQENMNSGGNGGGVYNDGTLTVTSTTVSGNSASQGGGIFNQGTITLTGTTIENNSATYGGGILNGGTLTDNGSTIENNSATYGGGIFNQATLTDDGGTIANNSASQGGGIFNFNQATLTADGGTIANNSASQGGGIFNQGTITLTGTTVAGNDSGAGGGGIYNTGALTLTGCTMTGNLATATYGYGGGIENVGGTVTVTGCTISGNSAPAGAAVFTQGGSLAMTGGTIQAPPTLTGNEIEIEGGASVTISGVTVDSASTSTAIDVNGGTLSATGISITGYLMGVSVENNASATITDSTLTSDATGILVGSGTSDTCTVTATNDSFASDTTGVRNNQTGGSLNATLDWWGSASGPTNASNPGGSGAAAVGNVSFSPWLGDANIVTPDYLVFLSAAGDQYAVTPNSGNTSLQVTLGGSPVGSIPGGDTLAFTGSGGTVTINGETGPGSTDVFNINNTSVQFAADDGLSGSTIDFTGTAITRNVDAQGTANTFNILGSGASGPSGSLMGDPGTNAFVFSGSSKLIGNIQGGGSSTLNYAAYSSKVTVNLGNGTNGTATGVGGSVGGITAVIGGNFNDTLNAGTVPDVALTGGLGTNSLSGTGAGDSVVESIASSYTLTNTKLTGTGAAFTDNLSGITVATLTGASAVTNTFTVSGWTGRGSLSAPAGTGTVTASKNAGYTLANAALSSTDGMALGLSRITTANLTDNGSGGNNFIITGWTGSGTLKGTSETLVDVVSSSVALAKTSLAVTGGATLTLSGFTTANLTDTAGGNTFTVSGWTGSGSLTDSTSTMDTVAASKSASYTLSNTSLSSTDGMLLGLTNFKTANLAATSASKTFTVSGWTGGGSLTDTATGIVAATKSAGFTLTNTSLSSTDGMSLGLTGITTANLTVTASSGSPSYIVDASAFTGVTNLTAGGTVNAFLFGGSANGSTLSATGSGNDVLIGGSGKDTLTDTGTGHNILIGGAGVDTLTGNGNDILISGTTNYDSNTSANIAALDAVLAEWSSSDSYSLRISKIMSGVGPGGADALNSSKCQSDGVANTVSDGASGAQNNWFIVNSKDKVTKQSGETETIV